MEFNDKDLADIALKKTKFIQSYGALDIFSDIEYLLEEMGKYRRREREDGFLDTDAKNIIASMRHLSTRKHQYDPNTCSQCEGAKKVMMAMKEGKL